MLANECSGDGDVDASVRVTAVVWGVVGEVLNTGMNFPDYIFWKKKKQLKKRKKVADNFYSF